MLAEALALRHSIYLDTALRTADSGYLTRRLIDVAQECMVVEEDCGVSIGLEISNKPQTEEFLPTFAERVLGRYLREPVADPNTAEILVDTDQLITYKNIGIIENSGVSKVLIGSPLFCKSIRGVCCRCYGASLSDWRKIEVGEAVGIIAAQSIGEPGTQLTMRTFHTGGIVDSVDITSGLPRIEELFEARSPKGQAVLSETDGIVTIKEADDGGRSISVVTSQKKTDTYLIKKGYQALVADGEIIEKDAVIAEFIETDENKSKSKTKKTKKSIAKSNIVASAGGVVKVRKNKVLVLWYEEAVNEYVIPANYKIIVRNGQKVVVGDSLTFGPKSPQQILSIQGQFAVQQYLVDEVQMVYRSQGVKIHDKHIELIVSRMLKKVSIDEAGDLETLPGNGTDVYTGMHFADGSNDAYLFLFPRFASGNSFRKSGEYHSNSEFGSTYGNHSGIATGSIAANHTINTSKVNVLSYQYDRVVEQVPFKFNHKGPGNIRRRGTSYQVTKTESKKEN